MRLVDPVKTSLNGRPFLDYALLDFGMVSRYTRYVKSNPFGINTPVKLLTEVYLNNKWSHASVIYNQPNGIGMNANFVEGEGVVLQVCNNYTSGMSKLTGGGHGVVVETTGAVRCRVHVWRLGL